MSPDPRQRAALDVLRRIAQGDGDAHQIRFSRHALDRMEQRGIVIRDVLRVLRIGDPVNAFEVGSGEGEVKLNVAFRPKGMREIVVVTLVVTSTEKVFVKTVMWRDE
jgi:hypothetical protein